MEKQALIKLRTTLKAGKNLPLRICMNNMYRIIDESAVTQFTKWDDESGILYVYGLVDPVYTKSLSDKGDGISLFAVPYDYIEALEVPVMPIEMLPTSIDHLVSSGASITAETKARIIKIFNGLLRSGKAMLGPTDINKITGLADGALAMDDHDDYYASKFTESFAETRQSAAHNAYVDKVNSEDNKN